MKEKVCIFGSNSIIANNFIENFSEQYDLIAIQRDKNNSTFCNTTTNNIFFDISQDYEKKEIDILSKKISSESETNKIILILFSWAGKPRDIEEKSSTKNWEANEKILRNFVEISRNIKPFQIIFISSAGTIYDQNSGNFAKETDKPNPESFYGKQKLIAEDYLIKFCYSANINITILRVASAFGFNPQFPDHGVINKWLFNAINNDPIKLYNSSDSVINFISFFEISKSIHTIIQKKIFGLFNIGSLESVSLRQLISIIKEVTSKPLLEEKIEGDIRRSFYLDTSLFKRKSKLSFKLNLFYEIRKIFLMIRGK